MENKIRGSTWYSVENEGEYREEVDADVPSVDYIYVDGTVGNNAYI